MSAGRKLLVAAVLLCGLGLSSQLFGPSEEPVYEPKPQPEVRFQVNWLRGAIRVSGHTLSQQHEQAIRDVVRQSFPDARASFDFDPLGTLPDYWSDLTLQIIYALQPMSSAYAVLGGTTLEVRAVATGIAWRSRIAALEAALPEEIELLASATEVPAIDVVEVCTLAASQFDVGEINFEEATATLRLSAFPRLQRIVAFADECRALTVVITGHTDASGSEPWNERLSLDRAQAVADYLADSGIAADRLLVSGVGSAQPVASNETRYGRSQNRRIEISFRPE